MASGRLSLRARLEHWIFRVRDAEPAPIVLVQRRIYVLPTPAGLAFGGALLVMLVASINYSLSLGFGLVFLLGGAAVSSILHAFRNLLRLSVTPGRIEPVFAGQVAQFHLLVRNDRPARRPALRLAAAGAESAFELLPDDSADVVLSVPASLRGWLPLGRMTLETTYPLGLIRAWSVLAPGLRCLVYPAPEADAPPLPQAGAPDAGRRTGRVGHDDFAGLRPHRTSDSPRHVSWKTLARGGPMLTKQFAGQEGGEVHLDWDAIPNSLPTEARLSRLAAWVLIADQCGAGFSLALPGTSLQPGRGSAHVAAALRALALFDGGKVAA